MNDTDCGCDYSTDYDGDTVPTSNLSLISSYIGDRIDARSLPILSTSDTLDRLLQVRRAIETNVNHLIKLALVLEDDPKLPNYRFNRLCGGINQYLSTLAKAETIYNDYKLEINDCGNSALSGVTIRFTTSNNRSTYANIALPVELQFKKTEQKPVLGAIKQDVEATIGQSYVSKTTSQDRDIAALQRQVRELEGQVAMFKQLLANHNFRVESTPDCRGWMLVEIEPTVTADPFEPMVKQLTKTDDPFEAYERAMRLVR